MDNNWFIKIILDIYIYIKKIFLQIWVLDCGINSLSKYPYKTNTNISVSMARTLLNLFNECDKNIRL